MNWENYIPYFISSLASILLIYWLQSGMGKEVNKEDGKFQLRLHKLYFYLGILCFAISLACLTGMIIEFEFETIIIATILMSVFLFTGLACYLNYQNHTVIFDEERIEVSNWKKEIKKIGWENISNISFNPAWGYLYLYDEEGKKIRISQHLVGLKKFVEMMEVKTRWTAQSIKFPMN